MKWAILNLSSQINSMNSIELQEIKEKIVPYLEEVFEGLGVSMAFVMLTNIVKESTELLCFGEKSKDVVKGGVSAFRRHETYYFKRPGFKKETIDPKSGIYFTTVRKEDFYD